MNVRKIGKTGMIVGLIVALSISLSIAASAITLKIGHNAVTESHTHQGWLKVKQIVEEKTNGEVKIEIYPANQLGGNREMLESTALGAQDMATMGLGVLAYMMPEYNFLQLPYIFDSQKHIHAYATGPYGEKLAEKMKKEHNIRLLSQIWDRMPRQIVAKELLWSPEDFQGLLLRAGTKSVIGYYQLIGAKPTHIPLNEMYLAMKQGVMKAVELPLDYFWDYSVYEVADYLVMVYHVYGTQFVGINEDTWQSLSSSQQRILKETIEAGGKYNNELVWKWNEDYLKKLKKAGMKVIVPYRDPFVKLLGEKVPELYERWPECKGMYEEIREAKPE